MSQGSVALGGRNAESFGERFFAGSEDFTEADRRATRLFCHIAFITCICLQRFGLLFGSSALYLSLPVSIGLMGWLLLTGRAQVRPAQLNWFLGFCGMIVVSTFISLSWPDSRVGISLTSPVALVLNYVIFLFGPTTRFDRRQVFDIFIFYARMCAILGIVQYLAQFVGIKIFSFMMTMPFLTPILVEPIYNYYPILTWGSSIVRSNGFFFVEASVFSQFLAVAICVEYFLYKQVKFIPVYALAWIFSFSGTGVICMIAALMLYSVFFFREAGRVIVLAVIAALLAASAFVILPPEQLSRLTERSEEFDNKGSSGYARYIGQFASVDVVAEEARTYVGFGPGATDRASFVVSGSGGTLQKVIIDYGYIGLVMFLGLIISAVWRRDISIIPLMMLSVYFLGGGKLFATPGLVFTVLMAIWSARPEMERGDEADAGT